MDFLCRNLCMYGDQAPIVLCYLVEEARACFREHSDISLIFGLFPVEHRTNGRARPHSDDEFDIGELHYNLAKFGHGSQA